MTSVTAEIKRALNVLFRPGDVVEMRILKSEKSSTISGYYDNLDKLAEAAAKYSGNVAAVYVTINPAKKALLSRAQNRVKSNATTTTADKDIEKRCWLQVDLDPIRPSEISSSEEEHSLALEKAREIRESLTDKGWPLPVYCDSGNGAHLDYRVDLPNDENSLKLIKDCLRALASIFNDDQVEVDEKTFNAARLTKLYGTMACKGDNTPERPHRQSSILEVPDTIEPVSNEKLRALADLAPKEEPQPQQESKPTGKIFDLASWIKKYEIKLKEGSPKQEKDKVVYVLEECPFDPNHIDASLIQFASGKLGFNCFHNICKGKHWHDVRELFEPGYKEEKTIDREAPQAIENTEMSLEEIQDLKKETSHQLKVNFPDNHFLGQFTKWMDSITDGYREYSYTSGLWALSSITKGKVALRLKQKILKPNLYFMNFGRSTTSRKSTVIEKTRQVYEAATDSILYNDDFSLEGYLETLAEQPVGFYIRDEAAGQLAKNHKKYNEGILELECGLYDGQNYRKTLASGGKREPRTYVVRNPYITKLLATTPDNFMRYSLIEDFTSGYGFRFLYTYPRYPRDRMPLTVETPEDIEAWANVLSWIKRLAQYFDRVEEASFKIDQEALKYFDEAMQKAEKQVDESQNDMAGTALGRSQEHILKIAMLLEIGKETPSFTITLGSMKAATEMVIGYFLPIVLDVVDRLQEDAKFYQIERVIGALRLLGGVAQHTKTLQYSKLKSRDFHECVETLIESKVVKVIQEKGSKALYYHLLDGANRNNRNNQTNLITYTQEDRVSLVISDSVGGKDSKKDTIERGIVIDFSSYLVSSVSSVSSVIPSEKAKIVKESGQNEGKSDNTRINTHISISEFCTPIIVQYFREIVGSDISPDTARCSLADVLVDGLSKHRLPANRDFVLKMIDDYRKRT